MGGYGWFASGWWWVWWVIWFLILIWLIGTFAWRRPAGRERYLTPIEVLQHRLARGEITIEEYEQRLTLLRRDRNSGVSR